MNRSSQCLLVTLLAASATACGAREQERRYRAFFRDTAQPLVPEFRLPDEAHYGPAWAAVESRNWRTRDGSGATKAEFWTSGEFNGDGAVDYAYILAEESTDRRVLFAFVSSAEGYQVEQLASDFPSGIWLRTRLRGRYAGAAPLDFEFEVEDQAIDLFPREGNASTFVWNLTTQSFDRYATSD